MKTFKNLRILVLLVIMASSSIVKAQTGINYQGLARRASGAPVAEQNIKIKLSIRDVSATGVALYTEIRSIATNKFGLFNVVIGSSGASSQTGTLAGVNWATGAKFLQVELDPDGGNNFIDMGTTQLQAVPYALYANDVAKIQGKALSTTAPTANQILKYNGTAWAPANEGTLSIGAVAASATTNAASITNGVLNLAPANATNPGIVSTGDQTFSGIKTFQNNTTINGVNAGTPPGSQNTMFGTASFAYGTPGNDNVALGFFTLATLEGGNNNTAVGSNALRQGGSSSSGNNNTALGSRALSNGVGGNNNVAIGTRAMDVSDPGSDNTAVGFNALVSGNSTNSTAIGSGATISTSNTIQLGNTGVTNVKTSGTLTADAVTYPKVHGTAGQVLSTTGSGTLAWTTPAAGGVDLTTNQTIGGRKTFSSNISANGVSVGRGNGNNDESVAIGPGAMGASNVNGKRNTAIGWGSMRSYIGTSWDNNTSVGYANLPSLTTGNGNTSVGAESFLSLTTGSQNTSVGNQSLISTTGNENVGIGTRAGQTITTGSQNTIIGTNADVATAALTNATALGYGANVSASNTIQLGNTSVTNVKTSGKLTTGAITYPNTDGASGQALITNGTGTASWQTVSGVSTYKQSRVSQSSATATTDSEIEVGGMVFRYNKQSQKIEIKRTTNLESEWGAYNTSRIESGTSQPLQSPWIVSTFTNAYSEIYQTPGGGPALTISGAYHSYEFELTPYLRGQTSDNHSFNIKVLLDPWAVVTLRVVYY